MVPSSSPGINVLFGLHGTPLFIPSSSFFPKSGFQPFFSPVTRGTTCGTQRHSFSSSDQGWNEGGQGQETPSLPSSSPSTHSCLGHLCLFSQPLFSFYTHMRLHVNDSPAHRLRFPLRISSIRFFVDLR